MNDFIYFCRICGCEVAEDQKLCRGSDLHYSARTRLCYNEHGVTSTHDFPVHVYDFEDDVFTAKIWYQRNPPRKYPEYKYSNGVSIQTVKAAVENAQ